MIIFWEMTFEFLLCPNLFDKKPFAQKARLLFQNNIKIVCYIYIIQCVLNYMTVYFYFASESVTNISRFLESNN